MNSIEINMIQPNRTESSFIQHCDGGDGWACDFGCFEYQCPKCLRHCSDYQQVWWHYDETFAGEVISFKCEKCRADLKVYWDREEMEHYVESI